MDEDFFSMEESPGASNISTSLLAEASPGTSTGAKTPGSSPMVDGTKKKEPITPLSRPGQRGRMEGPNPVDAPSSTVAPRPVGAPPPDVVARAEAAKAAADAAAQRDSEDVFKKPENPKGQRDSSTRSSSGKNKKKNRTRGRSKSSDSDSESKK